MLALEGAYGGVGASPLRGGNFSAAPTLSGWGRRGRREQRSRCCCGHPGVGGSPGGEMPCAWSLRPGVRGPWPRSLCPLRSFVRSDPASTQSLCPLRASNHCRAGGQGLWPRSLRLLRAAPCRHFPSGHNLAFSPLLHRRPVSGRSATCW